MVRGLEKNGFAAMAGFSLSKAALLAAVVPACSLMPVLAFLVPLPWLWLAGVIYFATLPLVAAAFSSTLRHDWVASLLGLLGVPVLGWAVARSAWQAWRTGHVSWRGTKYSLAELRSGRRVML
jgi:hypothetical protein